MDLTIGGARLMSPHHQVVRSVESDAARDLAVKPVRDRKGTPSPNRACLRHAGTEYVFGPDRPSCPNDKVVVAVKRYCRGSVNRSAADLEFARGIARSRN